MHNASYNSRVARVIAAAMAMLVAAAFVSEARAQAYPTKPIRIIAPTTSGGISDILARLVSSHLEAALGYRVLVENRPGGAGSVGTDLVAKAAPDGHTLCLCNVAYLAILPFIIADLPFDPLADLVPVAPVGQTSLLLTVYGQLAAANLQELIALAKREPGKLNFGSPGIGSPPHLGGEMLKRAAGIEMVHVPYQGAAPIMADLSTGQIQLAMLSLGSIRGPYRAGTVRVLAVASERRLSSLPDVPTAAEAGLPGYDVPSWFGIAASKGTPMAIAELLNRHIGAMMDDPVARNRLNDAGMEPMQENVATFAARIRRDHAKYGEIVRTSNIKRE